MLVEWFDQPEPEEPAEQENVEDGKAALPTDQSTLPAADKS